MSESVRTVPSSPVPGSRYPPPVLRQTEAEGAARPFAYGTAERLGGFVRMDGEIIDERLPAAVRKLRSERDAKRGHGQLHGIAPAREHAFHLALEGARGAPVERSRDKARHPVARERCGDGHTHICAQIVCGNAVRKAADTMIQMAELPAKPLVRRPCSHGQAHLHGPFLRCAAVRRGIVLLLYARTDKM